MAKGILSAREIQKLYNYLDNIEEEVSGMVDIDELLVLVKRATKIKIDVVQLKYYLKDTYPNLKLITYEAKRKLVGPLKILAIEKAIRRLACYIEGFDEEIDIVAEIDNILK